MKKVFGKFARPKGVLVLIASIFAYLSVQIGSLNKRKADAKYRNEIVRNFLQFFKSSGTDFPSRADTCSKPSPAIMYLKGEIGKVNIVCISKGKKAFKTHLNTDFDTTCSSSGRRAR